MIHWIVNERDVFFFPFNLFFFLLFNHVFFPFFFVDNFTTRTMPALFTPVMSQ